MSKYFPTFHTNYVFSEHVSWKEYKRNKSTYIIYFVTVWFPAETLVSLYRSVLKFRRSMMARCLCLVTVPWTLQSTLYQPSTCHCWELLPVAKCWWCSMLSRNDQRVMMTSKHDMMCIFLWRAINRPNLQQLLKRHGARDVANGVRPKRLYFFLL